MRTIVDIPDKQLTELSRLCAEQKISRAEAVRRALGKLLNENAQVKDDIGFGIWKKRKINARKFVDQSRSEWGTR